MAAARNINNILRNLISRPKYFYDTETSVDNLHLKKITKYSDESNSENNDVLYTYGSSKEKSIFKIDIITENSHTLLDIKISASFIVNLNTFKEGSAILRLKINDTLVGENETCLINNGYMNVSINYIFNVVKKSLYTVEVFYEGLLITREKEDVNLYIRNNGAQISMALI